MEVGLFLLSLCFSLSFFIPSHPHRTLPSTQTLISQISEKVGRFHFLSIYSSPTDCARQLGAAGLVGSLRLAPAAPARQLASSQCLGWLAGRTRDGWAGLLPCMILLLESLMHCVLHVPLARLRCWSGHPRMVHGIQLYPTELHPALHPHQASSLFQEWLWASLSETL